MNTYIVAKAFVDQKLNSNDYHERIRGLWYSYQVILVLFEKRILL